MIHGGHSVATPDEQPIPRVFCCPRTQSLLREGIGTQFLLSQRPHPGIPPPCPALLPHCRFCLRIPKTSVVHHWRALVETRLVALVVPILPSRGQPNIENSRHNTCAGGPSTDHCPRSNILPTIHRSFSYVANPSRHHVYLTRSWTRQLILGDVANWDMQGHALPSDSNGYHCNGMRRHRCLHIPWHWRLHHDARVPSRLPHGVPAAPCAMVSSLQNCAGPTPLPRQPRPPWHLGLHAAHQCSFHLRAGSC
mmetsp:Transcript_17288/g.47835  ORF Transcript_17288/g.47835 Transcript_17288/m.47835 type:complete len:251 (-) Transcript_17288:390-1142(-)